MVEPTRDLHALFERLEVGEQGALDAVFSVLYDELKAVARARRGEWQGNHTLNTTALIHEAYLKLAGAAEVRTETRAHFLSLASKAMRQILMNYARQRCALKRGGGLDRVALDVGPGGRGEIRRGGRERARRP